MNILVFGGSFNPPHKGHVALLQAVFAQLDLDLAMIIPSNIPPHKSVSQKVDAKHRLNMTKITQWGVPVQISCIELERAGKSFTVDTLCSLKEQYPNDRLYFLMGSDMLLSFCSWHCYEKLLSLATFCVAARTKGDKDLLCSAADQLRAMGGDILLLPLNPLEISSTKLRDMIKGGENTDLYLDQTVQSYIKENHLYE